MEKVYYTIVDDFTKARAIKANDISDGYHTMKELYEHRYVLFIALCKIYDNYVTPLDTRIKCWKSKLHSDGTMYEGYFILGMTATEFTGSPTQISYHLPLEYWNKTNVLELKSAPLWDGHNSRMALTRLMRL